MRIVDFVEIRSESKLSRGPGVNRLLISRDEIHQLISANDWAGIVISRKKISAVKADCFVGPRFINIMLIGSP